MLEQDQVRSEAETGLKTFEDHAAKESFDERDKQRVAVVFERQGWGRHRVLLHTGCSVTSTHELNRENECPRRTGPRNTLAEKGKGRRRIRPCIRKEVYVDRTVERSVQSNQGTVNRRFDSEHACPCGQVFTR